MTICILLFFLCKFYFYYIIIINLFIYFVVYLQLYNTNLRKLIIISFLLNNL